MKSALAQAPGETLSGFTAMLRDHGLSVGIAEQQAMLTAALAVGSVYESGVRAAWRSIACHSRREWLLWPDLFDRYWHPSRVKGHVRVSGQSRPSRDLRRSVEDMHRQMANHDQAPLGEKKSAVSNTSSSAGLDEHDPAQNDSTPKAMGGASRVDALHQREGQMWLPQDLGLLQHLARQISQRLRPRSTRRWMVATPGKRLDLRQTLRTSVAWGGETLSPAWKIPRQEPARLFILADVSRSMESHAPFFLRVARAFALEAKARVFVFHTRLAEVTPLMQRDTAAIQEKVNAVTAGFGAGTRIASSLKDFARTHARAQLRRGARVWIMSDGFDTDEPTELALALQGLRAQGAKVTWFYPTKTEPAARALQLARREIERLIPLATLADLAAARHVLN